MSHARSNGIMSGLRSGSAANNGFVNLGRPGGFSIHDAFEEEDTDEGIKVYGNASPLTANGVSKQSTDEENVKIRMDSDSNRHLKYTDDTTSRDSDSLIQEYNSGSGATGLTNNNLPIYYATTTGGSAPGHYSTCWRHPKVRENLGTVLAAVALLLVGTGLVIMGAFSVSEANSTSQGAVFFVAGFICFIPGAYHVVYVWLAARGFRGFDFYHLPLFT